MDLDPLLLSRVQFAAAISFHILFPAFTIGLAAWLVVLEARWLATGRAIYLELSEFWTRIFAISFGMGVVSGVVMSFQFGTNWSRLSDAAGNVLGPLLNYEVASAFFLEATFLGILLFGRRRVRPAMHFAAACMVSLGTLLSAFWILSANSWMQTPAGYALKDGVFSVTSWWDVVFNPSFPYRLAHMVTATFLTTAFVVAGVSAWHLLQARIVPHARIGFSMAMGLITLLAPLQILLGDLHGLNTLKHQPAKIAALEGHWQPERSAPLILFAWPDQAAATNRFEVAIPKLGSLILTHSLDGEVPGLSQWPPADWPHVPAVFFAFRVMVGLGFLMLGIAVAGLYLRMAGRLYEAGWFHWLAVVCSPIGFVALLAGWVTTEVGRQPWVVYGLMRTADAVTPAITGEAVLGSLAAFVIVYGLIFPVGVYYMIRLVQRGPLAVAPDQELHGRPARPLSATGPAEWSA
ncbi:MAG TPA: cytochrome ubiquinol oxidase subunit I [Geminicoccaceae bacterium]|nr:cytochrome ubiquinol oxidase subunit I [Geminicoccaceae bacterium]